MKALTIHPYYVHMIWFEQKTIEVRTWQTKHRGDILICSSREMMHGTIPGYALCVAELVNVRPLKKADMDAAYLPDEDYRKGLYAWELENIRTIQPIPVRGKPGLFDVDDSLIKYIPDPEIDDRTRWDKIWQPLTV